MGSRSVTPDIGDPRPGHAPFRRALTDEEKELLQMPAEFHEDHVPPEQRSKTPIDFPVTVPVQMNGSSSTVAFPVSSPEQPYGFDSPGGARSRYNSFAELHNPSFVRSRVQSRLGDVDIGEPGWRTRRESTA